MTSTPDRVAVVTGGARGIGFAISQRMAADGYRVAVVDRDEVGAKEAASSLPDGRGFGYGCDVADAEAVNRTADLIGREVGRCDALIANVGWTPNKPFVELTAAERDLIVAVNYHGSLNCCASFLPALKDCGHGRIVLISSDAARVGTPKETVYAGAKAALLGFGKSLALEVARDGITVNVVSPGSTATELIKEMLSEEQIERRVRANPMRRMAQPSEIAAAVAYFCGDDAAYVTGQVLSVNGGMSRVG